MPGFMAWLPSLGSDGTKILHLKESQTGTWKPYTNSKYKIPDYKIQGGSKGWATYQKLRLEGWVLVPTTQASGVFVQQHGEADQKSVKELFEL
jgi:hypothetical protein